MKKLIFLIFIFHFILSITPETKDSENNYESLLEIKTSKIPKSGNGVFAKENFEKGIVLGAYTGKFITEEEYNEILKRNDWHYVMWFKDCARPHLGKYVGVDWKIEGNIFSRINYAPAKFQNVKFEKICEPPYALVRTLRSIQKGEELYIDYGPDYIYDFMEDKEIQNFFNPPK